MTKKKILFIWTGLFQGGAETALIRLASELNKLYEVKILLCYDDNSLKSTTYNNIDIISITPLSEKRFIKFFKYFKMLFFIWENAFKSDVVIAYDTPLIVILTGIVNRLFFRKKIIYWIHVCKNELTQTNNKLLSIFTKHTIVRANKCISVSETCKNSLISYLGKNCGNIKVVYNLINSYSEIESHKNSNIIIISALGRLTKEKRFDLLVQSAEQLLRQGLKFKVIIGGDGPEREGLSILIDKLKLNNSVLLPGIIINPIAFISKSDFLISCSDSEALPYTVIEALQCKKPVIVTDTGAAEIVEYGKYGIVVERNNPKALADAIYDLAMNPLKREELSKKAHMALNKFDSKKIIEQWIDIIEN